MSATTGRRSAETAPDTGQAGSTGRKPGLGLKTRRRLTTGIKLGLLTLAVIYALFPVVWVISSSVNPTNSIVGQGLIPAGATLENFRSLVGDPANPFPLWMWNSIKISAISSFFVVVACALAAYSFSRFRYRGRRAGLLSVLLVQLFPNLLTIVALYLLLQQIGQVFPSFGLNSHGGLILIYAGGALGIYTWLMKGYFDTIPKELEESAMVDGASRLQSFIYVFLPMVRPILAVVGVLTFIATYADFLLPRVLLTSTDQYTLALGMYQFISEQYTQQWGIFSAAALVGALPIVIVFFALQRQLVGGLTSGGVKG